MHYEGRSNELSAAFFPFHRFLSNPAT